MKEITVSDLCSYIYNCIKDNKKIFRNNYGGFFVEDELSVGACNYSNTKEIDIRRACSHTAWGVHSL
jgi:hypothetical protein